MNKLFKYFLFLFIVSTNVEAQNPAIKIYVADAENSKNISNAKVCLEGFEIPAIKAQYNKKEKYYYFTEIPKNYNTVMVYHKKYNEKGFQDINGLPNELKFKLHEPWQNYYDFDYETSNELPNKKFYNYYVEDPYKIVIRPKKEMSYNDFRNYIYSYIKENNIEIEPVNPVWERYKLENNIKSDLEPYPVYNETNVPNYDLYKNGFTIFPIYEDYGYRSFGRNGLIKQIPFHSNNITFFFNKKSGEKFKRFNDKIISELKKNRNIEILSVTVPVEGRIISVKIYEYIDYLRKENKKFNKKNNPDFVKLLPFENSFIEDKLLPLKYSYDESPIYPAVVFELVHHNEDNYPYFLAYKNAGENNKELKLNNISAAIGLGFLDILEYYHNILK